MKIEYIFILIIVLGVVGYIAISKRSNESKDTENDSEAKDEEDKIIDEREKNEDKNTANASNAVQEKIKPEEKEQKIVEPIIIVGGIESKDYVYMIQQKGKEMEKKEEDKKELNKVGVFKDLTDYVMFYGETEEEGEWEEEKQHDESEDGDDEEKKDDSEGGRGEEVEEEEKRVKSVKEMRREVEKRWNKTLEDKKKLNDEKFEEYRLAKNVA